MVTIHVDFIEFRERFETLADAALTSPVVITGRGPDDLVVMSSREWERLQRHERRAGPTSDLPDEWLDAVRSAEVPAAFAHLDKELG